MLQLSVLAPLALLLVAATARPQTGARWPDAADGQPASSVSSGAFSGQFQAPQFQAPQFQRGFQPVRQGRRIGGDTYTNLLSTTTTTPAPDAHKKLVTLRPIGNNIQEILFNNGYRDTPGEYEPQLNNIDDYDSLDGLAPDDIWLLDDDLLVLKGGDFAEGFIDTTPIDDYEAPYREPRFPPPGFNPQGVLPPGVAGGFSSAGTFLSDGRGGVRRQPEAFIPEFGYDPYGQREGRDSQRAAGPGYRRMLPPPGFQFPATATAAAATAPSPPSDIPSYTPDVPSYTPDVPSYTPDVPTYSPDIPSYPHQQSTYLKKNAGTFPIISDVQAPAGYISSLDSLPRSFATSNQYPASTSLLATPPASASAPTATRTSGVRSAPGTSVHDGNGNYIIYTNHDGGFSYSYKTDGL